MNHTERYIDKDTSTHISLSRLFKINNNQIKNSQPWRQVCQGLSKKEYSAWQNSSRKKNSLSNGSVSNEGHASMKVNVYEEQKFYRRPLSQIFRVFSRNKFLSVLGENLSLSLVVGVSGFTHRFQVKRACSKRSAVVSRLTKSLQQHARVYHVIAYLFEK